VRVTLAVSPKGAGGGRVASTCREDR
jgi:hypothetical protein